MAGIAGECVAAVAVIPIFDLAHSPALLVPHGKLRITAGRKLAD